MLHVIQDARTAPAHFGAIAALFARVLQARGLPAAVMHLPSLWDLFDYPEAVQHVATSGTLLPSGLVWSERLLGLAATLADDMDLLMEQARSRHIVLAVPPTVRDVPFFAQARERMVRHRMVEFAERSLQPMRDFLKSSAQASNTPIQLYSAQAQDGAWTLIDDDSQLAVEGMRYCQQDRFGRWQTTIDPASAPRSSSLHVALIGSERDQYGGYPATLAALGDAADAAEIDLTIDFVTPQTLTQQHIAEHLHGVDGIVLPGGADMARVAGQIEAARFAYQSAIPIVGLCLGMQSMATAVARIALNDEAIGLAEVGASRPGQPYRHSFIPIDACGSGSETVLHHRLGNRPSRLVPGSRLQAILGDVTVTRYNHRYRLNDDLIAPLKAAGVDVCALGEKDHERSHEQDRETGQRAAREATFPKKQLDAPDDDAGAHYVDAIEAPAHPFFIGMQGHPELSSAEGRPHPLLVAFLRAAKKVASREA